MTDQAILLSTLHAAQQRLAFNRALQHLAWAGVLLLGAAVLALLVRIVAAETPGLFGMRLPTTVFAIFALAAALFTVLKLARREPIEHVAAQADERGGFHDIFSSALWLSRDDQTSPWVQVLLRRAAGVARGLDVRKLFPLVKPRGVGWLLMLGCAATLLWWTNPKISHSAKPAPVDKTQVVVPVDEDVQALRAQIDEAAQRGDVVTKSKLEKALNAIERKDASRAERRAALDEARDFIRQRNLEINAQVEQLQQLAKAMSGREEFRDVASALNQGDMQKAAGALKKIAGERADKTIEEGGDKNITMDELKAALQSAAQEEDPGSELAGDPQGKLQSAVRGLQELSKQLEVQQRLNTATKRLDSASIKMERQATLRANRYGQQEGQSRPEGSPETGNAVIQGGAMYRMGAVAQEKHDETRRDGGRAGDSSGDAEGNPVLGDEIAKVDAKYKLEAIAGQEDSRKDESSNATFYAASKKSEPKVELQSMNGRYRYVEEEAMSPERIALKHKAMVKSYFLQLRESPSK